MFGDVLFPSETWTQFGVRHVVKGIPGTEQIGILAPEILKAIQEGRTGQTMRGIERGDYAQLRAAPPPNRDITTQPIRQWEFAVTRDGYDILVTACCLEALAEEVKPAVIYFHGGGWRAGSRKQVQNPLRLLAQFSGAVIFNVEYRLAPEYRYPCATDDCWWVVKYVHHHASELRVDARRITVAGDSAGGNLAAACARRDRNGRTRLIHRQVLIYPALAQADPAGMEDYHFSLDDYRFDDSQAKWITSSILSLADTLPNAFLYVNSREEARSPDASPLFDTSFAGLPKTLLICAEFDYLTQQCRTYAKRLAEAGVDTTLLIYRGTNHGFMTRVGYYPQSTDLQKEVAEAVKAL